MPSAVLCLPSTIFPANRNLDRPSNVANNKKSLAGGKMRGYRTLVILVAALSLLAMASPAVAESRIEKNLELQPGGRFTLESEVGSVTVTGASRSGAHIVITSEKQDL